MHKRSPSPLAFWLLPRLEFFFFFFYRGDEMTVSLSFDLFYLRSPHSTYFEHAPAHQQAPASLARGGSSVSPWLPDESPPRR